MVTSFSDLVKDMTVNSVHTDAPLGNAKPKRKKPRSVLSVITGAADPEPVAKRQLQPNDAATAKSPFRYDPNALASLRPDQVPRFFGALTDSEKLPTKEVKLDDLHAMQDRVDPLKVGAIAEHGAAGKLATVVQHNGRQYIADGHHRLTADWLAGNETAQVRFKDLEPVDNALKRAPEGEGEPVNFRIAKVDEGLGLVFGWAIVCKLNGADYYDLNVDWAGPHAGERVPEHVPEPVMAKAALDLSLNGAPGNEMHEGPDRGHYPFLFPLTTDIAKAMGITTDKTGLMCAFKPPADVLAKFKDGTFTGFSIEGKRLAFEEHP